MRKRFQVIEALEMALGAMNAILGLKLTRRMTHDWVFTLFHVTYLGADVGKAIRVITVESDAKFHGTAVIDIMWKTSGQAKP